MTRFSFRDGFGSISPFLSRTSSRVLILSILASDAFSRADKFENGDHFALAAMSGRWFPLAWSSPFVRKRDHIVQQRCIFRTAEQSQALLKDALAGGAHRLTAGLRQVGERALDELLD
jgi:hypothetical protein